MGHIISNQSVVFSDVSLVGSQYRAKLIYDCAIVELLLIAWSYVALRHGFSVRVRRDGNAYIRSLLSIISRKVLREYHLLLLNLNLWRQEFSLV